MVWYYDSSGYSVVGVKPVLPDREIEKKIMALPRVGKSAPYFRAESNGSSFSIDDYKGRWLLLFSQPAHCTPADITDFMESIEIYPQLRRVGVAVLGLSVGAEKSVMHRIVDLPGEGGAQQPMVTDYNVSRDVSLAYGRTWLSGGMSGRSVYLIDDEQIVRAILYYSVPTDGRMREVLRILGSLHTTYDTVANACVWNTASHG